ncbi:MAG: molecular chaperone TorD family protein [Desulfosudaceae bacterium]
MNATAIDQSIYEDDRVTTIQSAELTTAEAKQMAARSNMYALLADVFRYPDSEFLAFVRQGELRQVVPEMAADLPFSFGLDAEGTARLQIPDEIGNDDVEAGFIRLFEAGPGDPPCPLVEGKHVKDANRRAIFEDLIRFYNHFGLSYDEGSHEDRPDHIIYEVEFMHYLSFLTLRAVQESKNLHDYLLAQRDFILHHLIKWSELLAQRLRDIAAELEEDEVALFYGNLAGLLDRFVRGDYEYLEMSLDEEEES